jgi:outer membrane protein TolC
MTQAQHTPEAALLLEEAITTLFCEIDDAYQILNPQADLYASLKKLSDSEVITLAIFQQSFEG